MMVTTTVSVCRTIVIGMITLCRPCRLHIIMDYDCVLYNRAVYPVICEVYHFNHFEKLLHHQIISIRRDVWPIKLDLTMQHFIEVPVPRKLSCYVFGYL